MFVACWLCVCLAKCPLLILLAYRSIGMNLIAFYTCQARPNIDATSPVDCECIMPLESWLLVNFKLLAFDSFRAAYKRCNEYGCWMSCCELLTAACATAFATLSMSVVDAVKPLRWCGIFDRDERTNGMDFRNE